VAADHAVGAQPLAHRIQQHRVQVAAMDRVLRPVVARGGARRFAEHQLAVGVEEHRLLRAHPDGVERGQQAQLAELARRMRQQVDAHAQGLQFGHRFVDAAGDAGLVQAQRQGEAADPGAQHDDLGRCLAHVSGLFTGKAKLD
jgi:hypothetical protein